jgi:seryl-tRNA synthetase
MLEVQLIRSDKDRILERLKKRNLSADELKLLDEVLEADDRRRRLQTELDEMKAERNTLSGQIGELFRQGKREEAEQLKSRVGELKAKLSEGEDALRKVVDRREHFLLQIPNVPHESVPAGSAESNNELYRAWEGRLPGLPDGALPHWELGEKYGILDMELGTKLTGSGFPVFRGMGARLERALISFFLDEARKAGYEEIIPPLLVNEDTARATGQLPDKEGQMYQAERDNLYLIPTAEVPITNIYRNAILDASDFPVKLAGYTPCFRREAGSYGAEVRGLNRVHQFDKVEIVQLVHPDHSYEALEGMLTHVAGLLQQLELPYRILRLCGGDLGFTAALTFDFEVYSAAQQRWLEVSSVSNFETYQSNRMKLRFRDGKSTRLVHTLNGSALALARIVAALLENNQTPDGIVIPKAIRHLTGFDIIS